MARILDQERQHLERLLREAQGRPLSMSAIKAAGIGRPGQLLYELELIGWEFEHRRDGVPVHREPPHTTWRGGRRQRRRGKPRA